MRAFCLSLLVAVGFQDPPAPVVIAKDADQPQLVADRDGVFYCVFLRNGNVELSTSADDGQTWSAPVTAINGHGKARGGMQRGPRIGVDDRKNVTITAPLCFDETELKERYPCAELWLARSTDAGKTFGSPIQVNEKAKCAPESLHAMAVAPSGEAHVAWLDMRGRAKGQDLYYAKIVDGRPAKNVKIGATLCECCAPGLALDGSGNPCISWRDGASSDSRPVWISISKDGGRTFKAPGRINETETRVSG